MSCGGIRPPALLNPENYGKDLIEVNSEAYGKVSITWVISLGSNHIII